MPPVSLAEGRGGDGAFVDVLCLGGDGGAYELVGVGFDDDEARFFAGYFFDEQVGGLVEAASEGVPRGEAAHEKRRTKVSTLVTYDLVKHPNS